MNVPTELKFCRETIHLKQQIEGGFLTLAERLYTIRKNELWRGEWDSYASFLDDMDMTEAGASKLVSVYQNWVIDAGVTTEQLQGIGQDKLYTALPLLKRSTPDEVLEKARAFKRDDLRKEVQESKGIDPEECEHEQITICGKCKIRL